MERELIHMLHESGWGIIRSAGSGSTPLPSADISSRIGAEPWIGIRINSQPWFFLHPEKLEKTKKGVFVISLESAKTKGLKYEELINKQKEEVQG